MRTIEYTEKYMIDSYSAILNSFSQPFKIELMECLLKSLKNEQKEIAMTTSDFIPEKSAEQIIAELRESRSSGKTRIIETF